MASRDVFDEEQPISPWSNDMNDALLKFLGTKEALEKDREMPEYNWTEERVTFLLKKFAAHRQQGALYSREARDYHTITQKYNDLRTIYQNFLPLLDLPHVQYDQVTGSLWAPESQWRLVRRNGGHECEKDLRERGFSPARLDLFRKAFLHEQGTSLTARSAWDSDSSDEDPGRRRRRRDQYKSEPKTGEKRKREDISKEKATKVFSAKLRQLIRLGPVREEEKWLSPEIREFAHVKADARERMIEWTTNDKITLFLETIKQYPELQIKYNSSADGGKREIFWDLL